MKREISFLLALALLAASAGAARAHAFLQHAVPPVGSVVAAAPPALVIDFTEEVEPAFCTVVVQNAAGVAVQLGRPQAVPGQPARLSVALPAALPPGVYTVFWQALAVDTHHTQGHFRFTIAPPKA